MAKAKDTAKDAPKARTSKAKEKAAEKALLQGQMAETPEPLDAEARKMRLKALIKLGKERGYLTYAEINDHLPDDVVDAESIEAIISTFSEMSIQVFDEAPAAEDLLMSDTAASAADDEEVEAQAEQALAGRPGLQRGAARGQFVVFQQFEFFLVQFLQQLVVFQFPQQFFGAPGAGFLQQRSVFQLVVQQQFQFFFVKQFFLVLVKLIEFFVFFQ